MTMRRTVSSLDELLSLAALSDVQFDEFGFERVDPEEGSGGPDEMDVQLQYRHVDDPALLDVRLTAEVVVDSARLRTAVAASFALTDGVEISPEVERAFLQDHAAVILVNFVREALIDLAIRARVPAPLLPLIGPGAMGMFEVDDQGDASH